MLPIFFRKFIQIGGSIDRSSLKVCLQVERYFWSGHVSSSRVMSKNKKVALVSERVARSPIELSAGQLKIKFLVR